jgi:hypothetical protein
LLNTSELSLRAYQLIIGQHARSSPLPGETDIRSRFAGWFSSKHWSATGESWSRDFATVAGSSGLSLNCSRANVLGA